MPRRSRSSRNSNTPQDSLHPYEAKFVKYYSDEELTLLRSADIEQLKTIVSERTAHVMKSVSEVEANPAFIAAQEVIKDFRAGLAEVKKYADTKKLMAIYLLQQKGVVDCGAVEGE